MDFFKQIKQKANRIACDHLASVKPARLIFFGGGDNPPQDSGEDLQAQIDAKEKEAAQDEALAADLADEFKVLRVMLRTAQQKDGVNETERSNIEQMIRDLVQKQIDERLALREEHLQEPETAQKNPAELRAELLASGYIMQIRPEGYLKDMAAKNNMTYDQLVQLNTLISSNFHVNKAKGWCYGSDTVYAYTSPSAAAKAEVILGFREADTTPSTPRTAISGDALATAATESYALEQARTAELYGDEGADILGTREALLSQKGHGPRRQESLRSTTLHKKSEGLLDPSLHEPLDTLGLVHLPFARQDWNELKDSWETVQGRAGIEEWLKRPTFKASGVTVEQFLQALAKDSSGTVRFKDLLKMVYKGPAQGEGLILQLAQQMTGVSIDQKEYKKILKKIKGNFLNDYDRMMDTLTLKTTKKEYIGNGIVRVSLKNDDQSLTIEIPIEQIINIDDVLLEDMSDDEIQKKIDQSSNQKFYISPEGQLMSANGEDMSSQITAGDLESMALNQSAERAIVMAMETIYQDVTGLYDLTAGLTYVEAQVDESYTDTRSRVEALRESDSEYGAVAANFSTRLGEAVADGDWNERDLESFGFLHQGLEALGFVRKGDEITYEDVESGLKYTIRKEELFKYYSGDAVVDDILDQFLIEQHTDDGSIETTFKLGEAIAFVNNDIIKLGLTKHPELVEKYGDGNLDAALIALKLRGDQLTEGGADLSDDQITLLQDGYLIYATMRHATEIQEGREAGRELLDTTRENLETVTEETTEITIFLPDEYLEAIYAANPQFDNPHDHALIADRLRIGFHVGTVKTIDDGVTHTRTHVFYDANGQEIRRVDVDKEIRPAGTLDATQLATIGIGINPINIQGLGAQGNQSLSFGFGGGVNFLNHTANVGIGGRYTIEMKNGIQVYTDAGLSLGGAAVGGGINIPIGEMRLDLHGHAYVGVPGGSVGAMLTLGNIEHRYETRLGNQFEKNGYTAIDQAIAAANQQPSLEVTQLILDHEDFKGMKLADIYAQFEAAGGPSFEQIKQEPGFQQFVMDIYRHQRSMKADEILHHIAANPISLANFTIGIEIGIVNGMACAYPVIGTSFYSQKLAFRSPTGIPYEIQGDDVNLAQLLHKNIDVTAGIMRGQVPKLVLDPENPKKGYVVAMEGTAHEGLLLGTEAVASYNQELRGSGLFLRPTLVRHEGEPGRTLMELSIADANGSLDVIPDPKLADRMTLSYATGQGDNPDSYFLAFEPGTNLSIRRINLHYPYTKDGAFEKTIIVITEQGSGVTYDQLLKQYAPSLRRAAGKRTIADLALSPDYLEGEAPAPVQTVEDYLDRDPRNLHDWTDIASQDQLTQNYINTLGYPGFGTEVSTETLTEFQTAAKKLMDQENAANAQFRLDFKKLSTIGGSPDAAKLQELCANKAQEIFGRELNPAELTQFIQTLTIYSFVDLHHDASQETGEVREQKLKEQQKRYEKMLHGYMAQRLTVEFSKTIKNPTQVKEMVDLVISRLEISADQWEMFDPEKGATLPEGGVFGSIVGTDRIRGIRITENYQEQEFYEILKLTPFDLHSSNHVEREVARAIISILNPLPKSTEMTPENDEAIKSFLRDDFTQRMVMVWAYKNPEQQQALVKLSVAAKEQNSDNFNALLQAPENQALLTELQNFVQEARAAELASTPQRVQLKENVYLNFQNVQASFFVFQRCGNVSLYLNEDIIIENEAGSIIGTANDRHVMVQAQAAERQLIIGLGVSQKVQHIGDTPSDVVEHHEQPDPSVSEDGSETEGPDSPVIQATPYNIEDWAELDGEEAPGEEGGGGQENPMGNGGS